MNTPPVSRDYWPTQAWRTAPPEAVGVHPEGLRALEQALASRYRGINGIVVVRRGCLVFESYPPGSGPEQAHPLASVTKSFTSALTGIAIDSGCIKDVHQPVLDFFPEYLPPPGDLHKRAITLRHLLTMTAPFAWKTGPRGHEPLDRLRRQPDWVKFILDMLGRGGQVGAFQYSSAASHLLSAVLTRATGLCAREFANQRLFAPLGMRQVPDHPMKSFLMDEVFGKNAAGWVTDPQGHSAGGWGLCLTPRDMARFGFLYLNRGSWDGQQVISEAWVDASTAPNPHGYGYQWWLKGAAYAASGYGGSHIFCVPGEDLVVAITSPLAARAPDRWLLLNEYILPAITD